jgi:hypothetical protein
MSSSHVPGAIAILCEANPGLIPIEIYNLLLDHADEPAQGAPYPNNEYGWGRLNIWSSVQAATAVTEISTGSRCDVVLLFPNPASTRVSICLKANTDAVLKVCIRDVTGRIARTETLYRKNTLNINEDLKPGVYFVTLQGHGPNITKKLVVLP